MRCTVRTMSGIICLAQVLCAVPYIRYHLHIIHSSADLGDLTRSLFPIIGECPITQSSTTHKVQMLIEITILNFSPLNIPWNYFWYLRLNLSMTLSIVPDGKINLRQCAPFKGELSVFSTCFTVKVWIFFKLYVITCFPLNIPWTYLWYFHFSWL